MVFYSAPTSGVLTVQLVEARDLHKEDFGGHNDAFIELWLDEDYKQRSETVENSENPVYGQTFTFNVDEGSSKHKLYYKVLDKDLLDTEKIGEGHIDIKTILNGEEGGVDTWGNLPAKLGLTSHGEIHFIIDFAPQ